MEIASALPNIEITPEITRLFTLMVRNVLLTKEKLEKSYFFEEAMKQLENPEMMARIKRVAGPDTEDAQLQVVLYGIGKIDPEQRRSNPDHCLNQLAFAILLREKCEWVNDIVVYDPDLDLIEQQVLELFDCTFLSVNEYGRRTVDRPTLFFMPRAPLPLFQNVLMANWTPANLNKIIILGTSFEMLKKRVSTTKYLRTFKHLMAIMHSENILHELSLPQPWIKETCDPIYLYAFGNISWHFITLDGSIDYLNLDLFPEDISDIPLEELTCF